MRRKTSPIPSRSRRQLEIEELFSGRKGIKKRLSILRRTENLRSRHKVFFKDHFKSVESLFTKEKSGKPKPSRNDGEVHLNAIHTGSANKSPFHPTYPHSQDTKVSTTVISLNKKKCHKCHICYGKSCILPHENGGSFRFYKNAPDVLYVMKWQKQITPKPWRMAGGVLISQQKSWNQPVFINFL